LDLDIRKGYDRTQQAGGSMESMEWLLTALIALVCGGLIGVKLGRRRTDVRQRKSAQEWAKGGVGKKKIAEAGSANARSKK
jgi:hypothetical protein